SLVLGEFCSFLYLFYTFRRSSALKVHQNLPKILANSKNTIQRLLSIALPATGSRLINSISSFIEPILVTQSLVIAGVATNLITKQYGELMGYVMPLLFLPTFITNSLSITIIPSLSEMEAKGQVEATQKRLQQALRISLVSGALATIVLSIYAAPILKYMYGTEQAKPLLTLMAPFFILLYIQTPLQASLQALDYAQAAMWNSLLGNLVKLSLILLLASSPQFGMKGVALVMITGVVLITLLHYTTLKKNIKFKMSTSDLLKIGLVIFFTTIIGSKLYNVHSHINTFYSFASTLFILCIVYLSLLYLFKIFPKQELKQIPLLNNFFK